VISPAALRQAAHAARNAREHAMNAKIEFERAAALLGEHVADFLDAQSLDELEEIPAGLALAAEEMDVAARAGGIP